MSEALLRAEALEKTFSGAVPVPAVRGVSFALERGDFAALIGPSGSGKTTLLNLVSGLDRPSGGRVLINGTSIGDLGEGGLCEFRRWNLGFVFQAYNLIPTLTVAENVEYTCVIRGDSTAAARDAARGALEKVGLAHKLASFPHQLSGGQQQRVAVARALASKPQIIFADEPTANLDSKTAAGLIDLFADLNESQGVTFLFSTHDLRLVDRVKVRLKMRDGEMEK